MAKKATGLQKVSSLAALQELCTSEEDDAFLRSLADDPEKAGRVWDAVQSAKASLVARGAINILSNADLARVASLVSVFFDRGTDPLIAEPKEVSEQRSLKPPTVAPATWAKRDLNKRENAPQFIRRVYAKWLGRGLERRHLATLDPALYKALSVWLTRNPDDPIVEQLPSQGHTTKDLIDRLSVDYSLDDLRKLGYAIDARLRRADH